MNKWFGLGVFVLYIGFLSIDTTATAHPTEEGKAFASQLHNKGYENKSDDLNTMKQGCTQQPQNQNFEPQACELSAMFDGHYDSGKKGEDPLKTHFDQRNKEAAKNKHSNQPGLGEVELLLKDKHQFQISEDDDLFKKHQEISQSNTETSEGEFQKGQPPAHPKPPLKDAIVTCHKGVAPTLQSCVKRLVIKSVPQADIVKNVTASFTARCYNLVTFDINLKTGNIRVSQCENQGPVDMGVNNPIGEPEYPDRTTIELISKHHIGEDGVQFRAQQMTPSYTNGFSARFTAFQPNTGRKKSHENNKNNVRGGRYTWKVTIPQKPILQETWEGCEDLERRQVENTCELVFSEQQGINQTVAIPGYSQPVTRSHWSENKDFLCGGGRDIDECEPLIQQNCEQIGSQCAVLKDNVCIEHKNTFRCSVPDYQNNDGLSFNQGQLSFLQGQGGPSTEGYAASDFAETVSSFSALTEMGKNGEDGLGGIFGDFNNPSVFNGKCQQCRVNLGSFVRDCCKLKGVLQGLLGKCNDEEKKLAIAALKNKRCVKVNGRYCHKKIARLCVEKRDSYCCYGSQLARILQEIAHQQLGIPWGDAKHPNCGSLTVEQLSQLDFDTPFAQQKLSEILNEIQASAQEKFNRVQQAVSASKSFPIQSQDWEKKQKDIESKVKHQIESQKPFNPTPGIKQ